jgi:hypothetical protein
MKTTYLACTSSNCRKTFRNEASLQKHLSEDHSEFENNSIIGYRCKKCRRVLGSQQSLKEHFYTHTGQKPYKCNEPGCGKYFRQSSQLSYHKRIHREVKNYIKTASAQQPECFLEEMLDDSRYHLGNTGIPVELCDLPPIGVPQVQVTLPNIFECC